MNIPTSEGNSSGCESGWTMYLDHSADNRHDRHQLQKHGSTKTVGYDEDDEDLSMVSDASSGPPNFHEDDQHHSSFDHEAGYNFGYGSSASAQARQEGKKIRKKSENQYGKDKQLCLPSNLDDTASSPLKHKAFPPGGASEPQALGLSQGFSATKFKGKSALHNHFSFFRSSKSGEPASGTAGDLQGRNCK